MFEKFTDKVREVLWVTSEEVARGLNHSYIGTEHILLALISEGECLAAQTLASFNITAEDVRAQIVSVVGEGPFAPTGSIRFTPEANKIVEFALRESVRLGHRHIDTGHLLLGLLRVPKGNVVVILEHLRLDPEQIRDRLQQFTLQLAEPLVAPEKLAVLLGETGFTVGDVLSRLSGILTAALAPIEAAYAAANQLTLVEAKREVARILQSIGAPRVNYLLCTKHAYELEALVVALDLTRAPRNPQLRQAISAFVDLCIAEVEGDSPRPTT